MTPDVACPELVEGEIIFVPLALTLPTLGVITTDIALVVDHVSVADCPAIIVDGEIASVAVGGEEGIKTVTIILRTRFPPAPDAVNV